MTSEKKLFPYLIKMPNPHYEHIRKVCIEKNPSILDLVMGCEWMINWKKWVHTGSKWRKCDMWDWEWWFWWYFSSMWMELLGRPITLQDVLFVFYSIAQSECSKYEWEWMCECWNTYWDEQIDYILNIYDLSKPFHEQLDYFYQWCAEQLWYTS